MSDITEPEVPEFNKPGPKVYYKVTLDSHTSGTGQVSTFDMPDTLRLDASGSHFNFYLPRVGTVFSYHKDAVLKLERVEEEPDDSTRE